MREGIFSLQSRSRVTVNVTGVRKLSKYGSRRTICSDSVHRSERRFPYYESLEPSPGRNGAGIFDFVPGARSRDTELRLFGQISRILSPFFSDLE